MDKAPDAFRTISEVADDLDVPQHVLRFWETRFSQIRPMKRSGGRRYYRPDDVDLLRGIRRLLYGEGYTIRGVQKILKEHGVKAVQAFADGAPLSPAAPAAREMPPPEEAEDIEAEAGEIGHDNDSDNDSDSDNDGDSETADGPVAAHGDVRTEPRAPLPEPRSQARAPEPADDARRMLDAGARARLRAALDDLVACRAALDQAFKAQPGKPPTE